MQDNGDAVNAHRRYLVEKLTVEIEAIADIFDELLAEDGGILSRCSGTAYNTLRMLKSVKDELKERVKKEEVK